jgi:hypothetical protein
VKAFLVFFILAGSSIRVSCQSDSLAKYIFVPHPRSEDKVHQTVLPGIEAINFAIYDMILLGGDLTYYTSIDRTSMDYCDSLFDLGSPNTLWTMGNHDLTHRDLIEEYTGRPSFYSYSRDNITFLVLDTELDAKGFTSSHISGDQLEMVRQVCDTISRSDYLVLLHGRLLWMIGNDYFKQKLDSVAESTKQLDTSNFYAVVYPLLQVAKNRGVPVLCLGGDKSKINIVYSPEDSITFIASTMAPEFTDTVNDVVILSQDMHTGKLSWEFVPLSVVEKNPPVSSVIEATHSPDEQFILSVDPEQSVLEAGFSSYLPAPGLLTVYSLSGQCIYSESARPGETKTIAIRERGLYMVRLSRCGYTICRKIVVP